MPSIIQIETSVPEHCLDQIEIGRDMERFAKDRKEKKYIKSIYEDSGIKKRYSVLSKFNDFLSLKSTKERNDLYIKESKTLITKLIEKTFKNSKNLKPQDITHIITVTCTGFYTPGIDLQIINEFSIPQNVERYHLGFMGCFGAFPAIKMANQLCQIHKDANVLVICLELCTIHFQLKSDLDTLLANSLFADGAAAAIVSNTKDAMSKSININKMSNHIISQGQDDMAWSIGDNGFDMVLSKYVSKIIGKNIQKVVSEDLKNFNLEFSQINSWAIHPGGKTVLENVKNAINISDERMIESKDILYNYGNMSSASILFVLEAIFKKNPIEEKKEIFALAFGPGLTVETASLTLE